MHKRIFFGVLALLGYTHHMAAQTAEEKELLHKARQVHYKEIESLVPLVKNAWDVLEQVHQGVALNRKIQNALAACWRNAYMQNDTAYSVKITQQDIMQIFEQSLLELSSSISYHQKQWALSKIRPDASAFTFELQNEYRPTVDRAQKLILRHLGSYIPHVFRKKVEEETDTLFKNGIRFFLLLVLTKYSNNYSIEDQLFIDEKINMFVIEVSRSYPYISSSQFESWIFGVIQDLLFSECHICMDHKADMYLSCCKVKNICKQCYAKVHQCPFCRAHKRC